MLLIKLIIILKVFHHLLEMIQAKGKNRKRKKVYYEIKIYMKLEQNSDCHFSVFMFDCKLNFFTVQ